MKTILPVIALTCALATWSAPRVLGDTPGDTTTCDNGTPKKHHHHKKCCDKDGAACTSTNSSTSQ